MFYIDKISNIPVANDTKECKKDIAKEYITKI
jgi:hypothetical protein